MAKRSPILGYNHNVRYRGLVFHVQTEDSGVMSPHLFTHLFYEGVIVSTRKLVYDASASEDAIKSLMQAQHKAVLKDLNKHTFDDKIDAYLAGTPGLEPRESSPTLETPRPSEPEIVVAQAVIAQAVPEPLPERADDVSEPIELVPAVAPPIVPEVQPRAKRKSAAPVVVEPAHKVPSRTQTAERTSRASQFRSMPPPPPPQEDEPATLLDNGTVAAEIMGGATVPTASPPTRPTPPPPTPQRPAPTRAATPPPIPVAARSRAGIPIPPDSSSPEIQIIQHEQSNRNRTARDTAVDNSHEAIPSTIGPDATVPSDGVPGRVGDSIPPLPPAPGRSSTPSRPPSHNAATLPPMRQPSRPAITPASVVSRPLPPEQRNRDNTDAIEVYAPAPPSVEPPPGERSERPGQYSMSRRAKDGEVPMREHTGRVAIPAGLGRPRGANQSQPVRTPTSSSPPSSIIPEAMRGVPQPVQPPPSERARAPSSQSDGVPRTKTPSDAAPPVEAKTITPPRTAPQLTSPQASRTGTGSGQSGSTHGPNVVMTRPAVIVGAPPKLPGAPTPQRVRKAREDEGRGFGQGLISEKSLDEVILAYLSEDADDK